MHAHKHPTSGQEHGRALRGAASITILFMAVELSVGAWSGSLSLFSDGLHMLLDSGALLLSLVALWISRRPSTPTMSFGYHRAEVLGALLSAFLILVVCGILLYRAIGRLGESDVVIQAGPAAVVAALGLIVNIVSLRLLAPQKDGNLNIRAAYLHVASDLLGSIGALASGVIILWTGWTPIDTWITFFIVALLVFNAGALIRDSVAVLMNSAPSDVDPVKIIETLKAIPSVIDAHDLHVWTVSHGRPALSVHLISAHPREVLQKAQSLLQETFHIRHTTIQIEHPDHFEIGRCFDCTDGKEVLVNPDIHGDHKHP